MAHCPTLGTGQLPIPQFPGAGYTIYDPGSSRRGVVVLMHGMQSALSAFPYIISDVGGFAMYQTLATDLLAEGYVVIWCELLADSYISGQSSGLNNDIANDTGHGSRLLTSTTTYWWDHVLNFIGSRWSTSWPIIPVGISWGGWHALQVAIQRTSTISAWAAHIPATKLWATNVAPTFNTTPRVTTTSTTTGATPGTGAPVTWTVGSTAGFAASGTLMLDNATPQIVRYTGGGGGGTTFTGVTGGDGTTSIASNATVSQSTFTSGLDVSSTAMNAPGNGQQAAVPLAYLSWCTQDEVVGFANTQILYTNANANGYAGKITQQSTTGGHFLVAADVTNMMTWFTSTAVRAAFPATH